MYFEWFQNHLQKRFTREERSLVHLFLSQVIVVVHWLHESTEKVDRGVADYIILPAESLHQLLTNNLSETERQKKSERKYSD